MCSVSVWPFALCSLGTRGPVMQYFSCAETTRLQPARQTGRGHCNRRGCRSVERSEASAYTATWQTRRIERWGGSRKKTDSRRTGRNRGIWRACQMGKTVLNIATCRNKVPDQQADNTIGASSYTFCCASNSRSFRCLRSTLISSLISAIVLRLGTIRS